MDFPVKRPISPIKVSKKDMMDMEKEITKSKSKPKPKVLKGEAAMKEYKKSISPEGMASANAAAKKALEKKYPGMFIPETRTTSGVKKNGKK
jgi:hypothetical protein